LLVNLNCYFLLIEYKLLELSIFNPGCCAVRGKTLKAETKSHNFYMRKYTSKMLRW
jgi:hypothetical protein